MKEYMGYNVETKQPIYGEVLSPDCAVSIQTHGERQYFRRVQPPRIEYHPVYIFIPYPQDNRYNLIEDFLETAFLAYCVSREIIDFYRGPARLSHGQRFGKIALEAHTDAKD